MSEFEWWQLIFALLTAAFGAWAWVVRRVASQVSDAVNQMQTGIAPLSNKIDQLHSDIRHLTHGFQAHQLEVERRVTRLEAARDTSIPINNGERRG